MMNASANSATVEEIPTLRRAFALLRQRVDARTQRVDRLEAREEMLKMPEAGGDEPLTEL